MTIELQNKLRDFIINNKLSFKKGVRNRDSVILSGYALHLGITDQADIEKVIESTCSTFDIGYKEEFNNVFYYAKYNNYQEYWKTEDAKEHYTF
jgi:methenyltetrahydromethanopterin cyclohydrolase